jgi:serine protease inhibitor
MSRPRLMACALAAALTTSACHADRLKGPADLAVPTELTQQEAEVSAANTAFGLELIKLLHGSDAADNLLISPLSASMSLGMAMNGARGETFAAMRRTLGFGELDRDGINQAYQGLIRYLDTRDPNVEFGLANAIWYERSFPVLPDFLQRTRDYFDATVSPLDFADPGSPTVINRWVEEETGGRIRELIDFIDPLDRLFLVNAVYFKAPWTSHFIVSATQPRPFTRLDGARVQVPTMMQDANLRWFRDDDVQGVELLYADSAYSMVILGPGEAGSLDRMVEGLSPARWQGWMERFEASRVMLFLPRFRFDYEVQLRDPLTSMGMGVAFVPRQADFMAMAPAEDLHISRVKQKSFIDVHELGTEAAAATSTAMSVTSMPPTLAFDRPFLFAIRERSSGTILFMGRIASP